jgi:hypothetical protein
VRIALFVIHWVLVAAISFFAASSYAQEGFSPANLTNLEKAVVGSILDSLGTKTGEDLKADVSHEIDLVRAAGKSGDAVVMAVKSGSGAKLPLFRSILVDLCVHGGSRDYCKLASLQDPPTENDQLHPAASAGGAGGEGFGGGPQATGGRNLGSWASTSVTALGGSQVFSFQVTSSPPSGLGSDFGTSATSTTVAVPGPIVGTGLPALVFFFWLRRRWKSSRPSGSVRIC